MIEELTEQHDLVMTEANLTDSGSSSESDSSSDSESDSGSESDTSSMAELITDIDNTIDEHHEEPIHKIDTPKQDLPLVLKDVKNPVDHVRFSPVESSPIVNYTLMHDQVYETVVEDIEIDDQLEPVIKDAIRPIQSRIESVPINQEEVEFALTMNDSAIDEEAIEVDSPKTRLPDLFQRINFSGSIFVTEEAYATYTTKKSCPEECQATFDTLTKLQSARRPGRREAQAKSSPTPSIPSQPSSPIKRSMDTREIGETKKSKPNMPSVAQSPLDILLPDKATRVLTRAQSHLSNDLQTASSTASTEPEPRSRFSKEDHKRFIMLFDKLRKNGKLPEPENKWYQQMLKDLEEEKSLFLKTQRSKILQSGVYSIIEPKLSALYHAHYTYQLERRHRYPPFYAFLKSISIKPESPVGQGILNHKARLLLAGQIAPCRERLFESKKIDIQRKYLVTQPKEKKAQFYRKRIPEAISLDSKASPLIRDTMPHVAISIEGLLDLLYVMHLPDFDMCMPLEVIAHPDGKRTICFDHAFPRQTINARDIYQCVFDAAFKSMNLDWKNRHDIVPSKDEQKDKQEDEKEDENLQYNTWTFGDLNILIRHQADAEMQNKEKQVMEKVLMDVKLDYFSHSLKEVVLPVERAVQWFRSYIHGHAPTLLARVHVPSHSVVSVEHKTMVDIMGKEWQPRFETNVLMHLFTHLHDHLKPGHYLLRRKPKEKSLDIFRATDQTTHPELNLDTFLKPKPDITSPESCYIPAWTCDKNEQERIQWTFPPQ